VNQKHKSTDKATDVQQADEYLLKAFPEGSKITIIEPFYKISRSGERGIRVDDPDDVTITPPAAQRSSGGNQEETLGASIEHSNKLLKEGTQICTMQERCNHNPRLHRVVILSKQV
jgi:hypothetical protein